MVRWVRGLDPIAFVACLLLFLGGVAIGAAVLFAQQRVQRSVTLGRNVQTGTPAASCATTGKQCRKALLTVINADRAQVGDPPLTLDHAMIYGVPGCPGAQGHARHMAEQEQISHDQFPGDVCSASPRKSENVGMATGYDRWSALLQVHTAMMAEPYSTGCVGNHHCTLEDPAFSTIGIGVKVTGPSVYLSEDFAG